MNRRKWNCARICCLSGKVEKHAPKHNYTHTNFWQQNDKCKHSFIKELFSLQEQDIAFQKVQNAKSCLELFYFSLIKRTLFEMHD